MKRQIIEPADDLAPFVKCYWNLESSLEDTPLKNTIVPDGTMKLIFHYGDTYRHHPSEGEHFLLPKYFLIGQLTEPYVVEPIGRTGSFVVRFHPYGFLPFTTIPIKDMENTAVPLFDLFGAAGDEIGHAILDADSTDDRIALIEAFLMGRLQASNVQNQILQNTIELISTANGQLSVDQLSKEANVHRRQLTRKFSKDVGLSPKQLSKIIRLQHSLQTLLNKKVSKLTDLAYENEYYDQAHFIKDFKEFTGLTPKEFYGDDLKMSLIFDTPE